MINIQKCRGALSKLLNGKYSLHVPPEKDDVDMVLSDAIDELEKYQNVRMFSFESKQQETVCDTAQELILKEIFELTVIGSNRGKKFDHYPTKEEIKQFVFEIYPNGLRPYQVHGQFTTDCNNIIYSPLAAEVRKKYIPCRGVSQ